MNAARLITHNGGFHADDVFACATLMIVLERENKKVSITRTRDEALMQEAEFVFDVGGIYSPETNRFDHHQEGGAGKRDNGIPYASFGLVWKKYGESVCGDREVADRIDTNIVQPIDAFDNGVDIFTLKESGISPVTMHTIVGVWNAVWNEPEDTNDANFLTVVEFAKQFLLRTIVAAQANLKVERAVEHVYANTTDKTVLVFDKPYGRIPLQMALTRYKDAQIAIYPHITGTKWHATTLVDDINSFEARTQFPEAWAGLRGEEFQKFTGIATAEFCHNARFLIVAGTKDDIVALVQQARSMS